MVACASSSGFPTQFTDTSEGAPVPITTFRTVMLRSGTSCALEPTAVNGKATSASTASNRERRTIRTGLPSRKKRKPRP